MPRTKSKTLDESDSDSDPEQLYSLADQFDKRKLKIVPEYPYRYEDMVNEEATKCIVCCTKYKTRTSGLSVCEICLRNLTIHKYTARDKYMLANEDLEKIANLDYWNAHLLVDVRLYAMEKHYDIFNPDIDTYIKYVGQLDDDWKEQRRIREEQQRNFVVRMQQRTKAINDELIKMNINPENYKYMQVYRKYIDKKASIKNTLAKIKEIEDKYVEENKEIEHRKYDIDAALKKKGIDLRSYIKSEPYDLYVNYWKGTLTDAVNQILALDKEDNETNRRRKLINAELKKKGIDPALYIESGPYDDYVGNHIRELSDVVKIIVNLDKAAKRAKSKPKRKKGKKIIDV